MAIFKASFESRNFRFEAFGATEVEARLSLGNTLDQHAVQYKIDHRWWHEFRDDIAVRSIELGVGYRDGEPITKGAA